MPNRLYDNRPPAEVSAGMNAMIKGQYLAKGGHGRPAAEMRSPGAVEAMRAEELGRLERRKQLALARGDVVDADLAEGDIEELFAQARADRTRPRDPETGQFLTPEQASFDGGARAPGRRWSPFDRHDPREQSGASLMKEGMRRSVRERHEREAAGADGAIPHFDDTYQPPSYR